MKKILLFIFVMILSVISYAQERFGGVFTFRLIDGSKVVSYEDFMKDWEIVDDGDYIGKFFDDSTNLAVNLDNKKLYVRYLDSLGYLSLRIGSWSPYAELQLINPEGDKMPLLFKLEIEATVDSLHFDKKGYYFFNTNRSTEDSGRSFLVDDGAKHYNLKVDFKEVNYWGIKPKD